MKKAITIAVLLLAVLAVTVICLPKIPNEEIQTTTAGTVAVRIPSYTYAKTEAESTTETTTEPTTAKKIITTTKPDETIYNTERGEHITALGRFYITGYTAEEGFAEGSATASGVGCRPGICAMNNTQRKELGIEWGDSIYIEGLGTYQVQDCGCAYGVIDIWFRTNATAYRCTGYYDVYI